MQKELLDLVPTRYLCPYCGEWHTWNLPHNLDYYDTSYYSANLGCERQKNSCSHREISLHFDDDYCYFETVATCSAANLEIEDKIPIKDIIESSDAPRVTFSVPFTTRGSIGKRQCSDCLGMDVCQLWKLSDESNSRDIIITFGFEFDKSDYDEIVKPAIAKNALESKKQENKEETTMANSIFNMNIEFGPNKDENIASTLMGVAVKNGDNWRIYDKKKKEITDVGDMQLGNLPIFIMPTIKLSEGDLIKDNDEYYFVTKVDVCSTQTLCAKTGEMKNVIPIKNILGFSCYSKVIALSDSLNMGDDFDVEKLAIMSAMFGQPSADGNQMNQLLPLMLFKDELGGDDDMMKMMLVSSMMTPAENGNQMNQLLPLMLFKDELGGSDDMMKMMLMSSAMGGNMAGNNSPVMNYLMLDTFMKKKNPQSNKKPANKQTQKKKPQTNKKLEEEQKES